MKGNEGSRTLTAAEEALLAAENGQQVEKLIRENIGLNLDCMNRNGYTCLNAAAESRDFEMAEVLLRHGADPNLTGFSNTPLISAVCEGDVDIVRVLLQFNADVNLCPHTDPPVALAASALHFSPERQADFIGIVRLLVEHGADVNALATDDYGHDRTPLSYACEIGNVELVTFLLDHGANVVDAEYDYDSTPLHVAVNSCPSVNLLQHLPAESHWNPAPYIEIVRLLVEHGAYVNDAATDDYDRTPLSYACENGSLELVTFLLDHGANVDGVDHGAIDAVGGNRYNEYKPLHIADHHNREAIIHLLCERGARIYLRDRHWKDVMDYARENGHEERVDYYRNMLQKGLLASEPNPFRRANMAALTFQGPLVIPSLKAIGLFALEQHERQSLISAEQIKEALPEELFVEYKRLSSRPTEARYEHYCYDDSSFWKLGLGSSPSERMKGACFDETSAKSIVIK